MKKIQLAALLLAAVMGGTVATACEDNDSDERSSRKTHSSSTASQKHEEDDTDDTDPDEEEVSEEESSSDENDDPDDSDIDYSSIAPIFESEDAWMAYLEKYEDYIKDVYPGEFIASSDAYCWFQDMNMDGSPEFIIMGEAHTNDNLPPSRPIAIVNCKGGNLNTVPLIRMKETACRRVATGTIIKAGSTMISAFPCQWSSLNIHPIVMRSLTAILTIHCTKTKTIHTFIFPNCRISIRILM